MDANVTFTAATIEDQGLVFAMHEALFRESIDRIWGWDDAWQRGNFRAEWLRCETSVIRIGGAPAGYLQIRREPDHLYVMSLGLLPEFQGRGTGADVLTSLKQEAADLPAGLRLSVFRINLRALSFYQRHGFRIGEETDSSSKLQWTPDRSAGFSPHLHSDGEDPGLP